MAKCTPWCPRAESASNRGPFLRKAHARRTEGRGLEILRENRVRRLEEKRAAGSEPKVPFQRNYAG
eukprot:6575900-Lingulodinium_polyedra.AAC.1